MSKETNHSSIDSCLVCFCKKLNLVIDLGQHPLANTYTEKPKQLEKYPLALNRCNNCGHYQLTHAVNPDLLFKDYKYVSGTSNTLREVYREIAKEIAASNSKGFSVLDVASNDGLLLDFFYEFGAKTAGIDPAENLINALKGKTPHDLRCGYLHEFRDFGAFDVVTAFNVLAHNANPSNFFWDLWHNTKFGGEIYIMTSQADMIKNNEFDTIYHEHISFFTEHSMLKLASYCQVEHKWTKRIPIHGGSNLYKFVKPILHRHDFYRENVQTIKSELLKTVNDFRNEGYRIIGYGAAAKGMTVIGYTGIDLEVIIDDNPLKQGLYSAVGIKVESPEYIKNIPKEDKVLFVPLAWNFFDEIVKRIRVQRNNSNDSYLKYFPKVEIIDVIN